MTSGNSGGYSGRRAPNFSQYLNELNMIPSPYDQALQQQQERNDVFDNIDSNLAMFANAEFLDFDTGLALSAAAADAAVLGEQAGQQSVQGGENDMERRGEGLDGEGDGLKYFDMLNGAADFNIPSFTPFDSEYSSVSGGVSGYPTTTTTTTSQTPQQQVDNNSTDGKMEHSQQLLLPRELQHHHHHHHPQQQDISHMPSHGSTGGGFDPLPGSTADDVSPTTTTSVPAQKILPSGGAPSVVSQASSAGMRRKSSTQTMNGGSITNGNGNGNGASDFSRLAQEEDRRRRNTAASARFRVKKKEREKNMERMVKEMTMKNATLETRVSQLEMENKWLKSLITEKNSWADSDISSLFQKFKETTTSQQQQAGQGQDVEGAQSVKNLPIKPANIQPNIQPQPAMQVQPQQPQTQQFAQR